MKEREKEEEKGEEETFFLPHSLSLSFFSRGGGGERSLVSLFVSLPLPFLSKRTWNVASSLTNAGSPLRLPSTSFSESRCATWPERSRWALLSDLTAQTRPEARCRASCTFPNEPVPVFFFFSRRFFFYAFFFEWGDERKKESLKRCIEITKRRLRLSPRTTPRSKEESVEPWRLSGGGERAAAAADDDDDDTATATVAAPFPPAFAIAAAVPSLGEEPDAAAVDAASEVDEEAGAGEKEASPEPAVAAAASAAAAAFAASFAAAASAFLFFARWRAEARRGICRWGERERERERARGVSSLDLSEDGRRKKKQRE